VLRGALVVLRPARPSDKADRLACGRDAEMVRMLGGAAATPQQMTETEVEIWYRRFARDPLGWVIEAEGRCVGSTFLHSVDEHDRRARFAIGLFDAAAWNRGYGTEATRLVLRHAFETLRLHRVELRVLEYNARAIACYRKCGFIEEGRKRQDRYRAGAYHDTLIMGVLEDEFRALHGGAS
jgi:RimJ/RimL family protein N-acetyltransferase